jgi:hypothetical protein
MAIVDEAEPEEDEEADLFGGLSKTPSQIATEKEERR